MKTGRNDPCPCGSGKKYKKCCARADEDSMAANLTSHRALSPAGTASSPTRAQTVAWAQYAAAGRYRELEDSARQLLHSAPNAGLAWKVLGLALWKQGKDPLEAITRAAALLPQDAEAHSNLGNALRAAGRVAEAIDSHRRAIAIQPRYAEAHNNLGSALRDVGQLEEAVAAFQQAVAIKSDFELAHANLGNALLDLGRTEEAVQHFERAVALKPALAEAHTQLGNTCRRLGRLQDSAASLRRALELQPENASAHSDLGDTLRGLWQLHDAVDCYQRSLQLRPDSAETYDRLGNALLYLGDPNAVESCRRATDLKPDAAQFHNNLGMVLLAQGHPGEAEASFQRALALDPALTPAMTSLAELYADRGQFDVAEAHLQRALAIEPDMPEAWAGLVRWRKTDRSAEDWLAQAERIVAQGLPSRRELHLQYALGKYFDDLQRYDAAFAHYHRANELSKQHNRGYDREAMARQVDTAIEHYDSSWVARNKAAGNPSVRPVFVVGMWRSGTTLAEQILASHPMVYGADELPYWNQAAALVTQSISSRSAPEEVSALMGRLADEYLQLLDYHSADAQRVVDKMCSNFLHLGLITAALPRARIIHLQRHPVDTCLSMYFQDFLLTHTYANDLEDLAHYYSHYRRIMRHWQQTLDAGSILEVPYEQLVTEPEAWTRRMLEFLELPWEPRCLEFHRTERSVRTVSKWQVRQRIHKGSVGRWRNYAAHLSPLLTLLELEPEPAMPDSRLLHAALHSSAPQSV